MNRVLKCAALCVALATAAPPASAALQLRVSDGTPAGTLIITDQGIDDANPTLGVVSYTGPVGSQWLITVNTGTSKPVLGSAAQPDIDLNSFDLSSTSGGTLTVELTDTDYTGSGPATINVGGNTAGTVLVKSYVDYNNTPFGKSTPISTQGPFSPISFSGTANGVVMASAGYSITLELQINHVASGSTGLDVEFKVMPPTYSCPTNTTVRCGESLNPDVNPALGKPTYTGAPGCLPASITYADVTNVISSCNKIITRTFTIADACGVTNFCTQEITVFEDVAPVLTVPANVTVECNGIPPVGIATGSDNCDTNVIVSYLGQTRVDGQNPACSYTLIRTFRAVDSCGNAVTNAQSILVRDTTAPVLTVPGPVTVECSAIPAPGNASATDNCDANPVVTYLGAMTNGSGCNFTITRKWKAADACGNAVTNSQLLTVRDTTPPVITCPPDVTVMTNTTRGNTNTYCSYTQGGWGSKPSGHNPGTLLRDNFSTVYPSGVVEIGIPGNTGFSARFTSTRAIQAFLPSGGTPGALNGDLQNPTSSSAGVFAAQVLALKLNVDFSTTLKPGATIALGDLVINDPASPFFGLKVRDILALAQAALGGSNTGYSYSSLNTITDNLNQSFDNCVASSWARSNLLGGGTTTSTNTGTATATDNCDPQPAISYTDTSVPGACPGSLIITRTWQAIDRCGNSNTCVQKITLSNCVSNPVSGSICGSVLRDCDANSNLTGESGLSGWTVTLKNATTLAVIATKTTDASGNYCFTNLVADSYCVVVTPMANYGQTVDPDATLDSKTCFALAAGQNKTGVNFGYTGTAPSVNIVMTGPATARCGDTITYSICVTNTGNTCVYGGLEVQDPLLGGQIFHQTPVAPGQGFCFTRTYVIPASYTGTLVNTATAIGHPPGHAAVTKSVSVSTTVTCTPPPVTQGCTLTIGYYKNHSSAIAPLPINLGTAGGAKTLVVSSQTIGVSVLGQHTYGAPANGITKLYAQLLAAKLNGLRGASGSAVSSTISAADAFLATHNHLDWGSLTATEKNNVAAWHTTLDRYNNGLIGPGHCGDQESNRALDLKSTPGNKSVMLVWIKSTEATSYKVMRGVNPDGPYTAIKTGYTSTNYTDTAVTNGVAYYYVIAACKNGVAITDSDEVCATPFVAPVSPWKSTDIGTPGYSGAVSVAGGIFTILGGGDDIWSTADKFRFTYQSGSGDGTVIARVTAVGNTDAWAKAGVMIRETLTPGSKHAFMCLTPGNGASFQSRNATGGSSLNANTTGPVAPYWVKVTRVGNVFTGYTSANGTTWTKIGQQTITMTKGVYIGLAVTSHNDGALSTATFQNVTATP